VQQLENQTTGGVPNTEADESAEEILNNKLKYQIHHLKKVR